MNTATPQTIQTPLILLHGALGTASQFDNLRLRLPLFKAIYTFDFKGHGAEVITDDEKYNAELLRLQLEQFIIDHQLERVNIFGHSMGGYVALMLALKNSALVNRVFTLGTMMFWDRELYTKETLVLNPETMEQKIPAFVSSLKINHQTDWRLLLKKVGELLEDLGESNYLAPQNLEMITSKVRIALGDRDTSADLNKSILAFQKMKGAELQVFPATPHPFIKINLDALAYSLVEFFQE
jgi:pimeloyl-ACP methyl ester carboxylesterase